MHNIVDLIHLAEMEKKVATKQKTASPTEFVAEASIVLYFRDNPNAVQIMFTSMAEARKQYDALVKWHASNAVKPHLLMSPAATMQIGAQHYLVGCMLVATVQNAHLITSAQKKLNALMQQ